MDKATAGQEGTSTRAADPDRYRGAASAKSPGSGYWEPGYAIRETDAVALFRIRPQRGVEPIEAAAALAGKSDTTPGTLAWSQRWTRGAHAFRLEGVPHSPGQFFAWVAYDTRLFEKGSIANLPAILIGNVARFRSLRAARLEDIQVPAAFVKSFPGPATGVAGERQRLGKFRRPLLAATTRPGLCLSGRNYGRAIYQGLAGGLDFVHAQENIHAPPLLPWRDRFLFVMDAVNKASVATGETKGSYLDVTAATVEDMYERAQFARQLGALIIMVNAAVGWTAIQSVSAWARNNDMILHLQHAAQMGCTHRHQGVSLRVIAKWLRLAGVDHLHAGAALGRPRAQRLSMHGYYSLCRDAYTRADRPRGIFFDQDWCDMRRVMPVACGGIHARQLHEVLDLFGDDVVLQLGGATLRHQGGLQAAALANREALEAMVLARDEGQDIRVVAADILRKAARLCRPLQQALDTWDSPGFGDAPAAGTRVQLLAGSAPATTS